MIVVETAPTDTAVLVPELSEVEALWTRWIDRKAKRNLDSSYIATLRSTMRGFLRSSKVHTFADLHPRHLPDYLRAEAAKREYARSYLVARSRYVRWFVAWAAEERGFADPFASFSIRKLPKLGKREKSVQRRALLLDEWAFLRRHVEEQNVTRRKLTAEMRILLYSVALQTGFRAVECSRLRIMDLHEEGGKAFLELSGKGKQRTKYGRLARQFIKQDLADCLKGMFQRRWSDVVPWLRRTDSKIFPVGIKVWQDIASILRMDLAAARAAYRAQMLKEGKPVNPDFLSALDSQGQVVDFHALRYTCGAWLVHLRTDIKTVQKIMRHGTSKLTLDTYGAMYPGNDWEAVMKMPETV